MGGGGCLPFLARKHTLHSEILDPHSPLLLPRNRYVNISGQLICLSNTSHACHSLNIDVTTASV